MFMPEIGFDSAMLAAFLVALAEKSAEAPAKTFKLAWEYVFGPANDFFTKANNHQEIEKYIESIKENTANIPDENIQIPEMDLLLPALESSKYFLNESTHRNMFAKLVSTAFDKTKHNMIHHAYATIITQMNALDAQILTSLDGEFSLISCDVFYPFGGKQFWRDILINQRFQDFNPEVSIAINNLERLNLINVFHSHPNFQSVDERDFYLFQTTSLYRQIHPTVSDEQISITKEPGYITPLGNAFRQICL